MSIDANRNEINKLERNLEEFRREWDDLQSIRAKKWRKYFLSFFVISILLSLVTPNLWWSNLAVIGYFAGSLYIMLRQNAQTSKQIHKNQKQLRLAKLLKNTDASPVRKNG